MRVTVHALVHMYTQEGLREDTLSNEHAYLVEKDPLLKHKYGHRNEQGTNTASLNALLNDIYQALGALDVLYNSYFLSMAPGMQAYPSEHANVSAEFLESCTHDEKAIFGLIRMARTKIQSMQGDNVSDNQNMQDMLQKSVSNLMDSVRQIESHVTNYKNSNNKKQHTPNMLGVDEIQKTMNDVKDICRLIGSNDFIKHGDQMRDTQHASLASRTSHRTQNNNNNANNNNKNPAPALIKRFSVNDWICNLLDIPNQQNIGVHYVRSSVQIDFTINPLPYIGMSAAENVNVEKYSVKEFAVHESVILSHVHSVHFPLRNFGDACERYIANWLRVISDNAYIPATQYKFRISKFGLPEKFIVLGCRDNPSFAGRLCLCGFFVDNRAKTLKFVFLVPNPISPRSAYV